MREKLKKFGIIPVIKIENPENAVPLAKALRDGGLNCAEITFRTATADISIKKIREAFPDMLIGAGTVLNAAQVDKAIAAGVDFIVSPGFNPKTVQYCIDKKVPILPGCITPSEIEQAIEMGLDTVKFFPSEQAGGLAMIKAMSAPYGDIMFMPTGGISLSNLAEYLKFNKIVACGGSFMVTDDMTEVTELTKKAVEVVKNVRG